MIFKYNLFEILLILVHNHFLSGWIEMVKEV